MPGQMSADLGPCQNLPLGDCIKVAVGGRGVREQDRNLYMADCYRGYHSFRKQLRNIEIFWRADGWWWWSRARGYPPAQWRPMQRRKFPLKFASSHNAATSSRSADTAYNGSTETGRIALCAISVAT